MKIISSLLLFFLASGIQFCFAEQKGSKKTYVHPSFKALLIIKPRKTPIVNPMVPRISPEVALRYYGSDAGIFIAAGGGAIQAGLPGAISLSESLRKNPSPLKRFKNKIIIIFCH